MNTDMKTTYEDVLEANRRLHTRMADEYNEEPHFRPENIAAVDQRMTPLFEATRAERLLDLGCGTGFIINIAKHHVRAIDGVDATQAMLDKVDTSGPAEIRLVRADTATVELEAGAYDVVTAYSLLHHLYDRVPTLHTAFHALREGGRLYVDLEPSFYFWEQINRLDPDAEYHPIVAREVEMVTHIDAHVAEKFDLPPELMNQAEYGKNVQGGLREEDLLSELTQVGFKDIHFFYNWFLGQGALINDASYERDARFRHAEVMAGMLQRAMPVSRPLFKYFGFTATR